MTGGPCTFMLGWDMMNSPTMLSYVNPNTPSPTVMTRTVEEEYRQYPAASRLDPGWHTFRMQFCTACDAPSRQLLLCREPDLG